MRDSHTGEKWCTSSYMYYNDCEVDVGLNTNLST